MEVMSLLGIEQRVDLVEFGDGRKNLSGMSRSCRRRPTESASRNWQDQLVSVLEERFSEHMSFLSWQDYLILVHFNLVENISTYTYPLKNPLRRLDHSIKLYFALNCTKLERLLLLTNFRVFGRQLLTTNEKRDQIQTRNKHNRTFELTNHQIRRSK